MSCLLYLKNVTNSVQPKFSFNVKTRTTGPSGIDITPAFYKTYTYDAIPSISADGVYQFYTNINNVANFDASLNILNILTYSKSKLTQTNPIVCTPEKEYITEINLTITKDTVLDYVIGNTILQYNNSSFNLSFDTAALTNTETSNAGINKTLANLLTFLYGGTAGRTFTVEDVAAGVELQ
jgi:hypothetical protein